MQAKAKREHKDHKDESGLPTGDIYLIPQAKA